MGPAAERGLMCVCVGGGGGGRHAVGFMASCAPLWVAVRVASAPVRLVL